MVIFAEKTICVFLKYFNKSIEYVNKHSNATVNDLKRG